MTDGAKQPARRRVVVPTRDGSEGGAARPDTSARPDASVGPDADGSSAPSPIFEESLMRAQLRLAIATALGFAASLAAAALAIAGLPILQRTAIAGVPVSWLLQAYGMYPLIAVFAAIYVGAAARNERRYRALRRPG